MKRIFSLLLCFTLVGGLLSLWGSMPLFASADYEAELWSPVEIRLVSTVKYANAYTDAELDATFTHEDGTVISLPGFWDGGQNWAVRFSPTKTGLWTFSTTCSNAEDTGLITQGTVRAVPSTGSTDTAKHGFIRLSENKRYFVYDDGTPFFWLGDTHWQSPECVPYAENNFPYSENDSMLREEIDNRVAKGFTVYQTYFACNGAQQGLTSYWSSLGTRIKPAVFQERIDKMFEYIHESGMVIAMGFGLHSTTPNMLTEEQHLRFIRYCIARYTCYNIVWITGQEITNNKTSKTPGKSCMDVWMNTAAMTDRLDGYNHPQGAHMYSMEATAADAMRLYASSWHELWLIQAGHGGQTRPKSYYEGYYNLMNVRPVIEGEANYEDINCGVHYNGYDAPRWSAWKAMLCGCAGFTYGATGIWASCYSTTGRTGWYSSNGTTYSYEPWYMGLNKPGSYEVGYMRAFFENLPDWTSLVPRFTKQTSYGDFVKDEKKLLASTEDGHTYVCYFFNNDTSTGTLFGLDENKTYRALWFNPLTGKYQLAVFEDHGTAAVLPEKPNEQDWVLLLTCDALKNDCPSEAAPIDLSARGSAVTGSAVTPQSVTAIGGLTYNAKQELQDPTAALFDNNTATVWRPLADRVSQTILYDLGTAQTLTHIVISPAKGYTLPRYRVEGSNDGSDWTILVNTAVREPLTDGDNVSEPLQGAYRYVKILLLPAKDIGEAEALNSGKEYYYNPSTHDRYYRTAIAEITVYSDGEGTPETPLTPISAAPDNTQKEKKSVLPVVGIASGTVLVIALAAVLILKPKKK